MEFPIVFVDSLSNVPRKTYKELMTAIEDRYVDRQHGNWSQIKQAEVDVSMVQPDYIIEGTVDLVKDLEKDRERIEHYRRQLHIYAYLIEHRTGQKELEHLKAVGLNAMITFLFILRRQLIPLTLTRLERNMRLQR
ncbi:unnamed protein product [Cylicostephanus goldi]|uniref:Uncharacterized protein n=1 Tax=Cylicostephanus goldi TaxID=71465 RepID=A0A3P7Q943_CYLGO|nr:unnamed protein product [Cylicostephanus goldi]